MRKIYASIDIGTDSIKVIVCELFNNKYNLLASSSVASKGITKGAITDIVKATECISLAINKVEEMLNFKLKKVIAIIPSIGVDFKMVSGNLAIEEVVSINDINNLQELVIANQVPVEMEIVSLISIDYLCDEQCVVDPNGVACTTLLNRSLLVLAPKKNIYSVTSLLTKLGLEVVDVSLGCVSDLYCNMNDNCFKIVTSIINIGETKTEVSIFNKGVIVKHSIISMGSLNVDMDIAYIYKISLEEARNLKEKFALAHKTNASLNETKEVKNKNDEIVKINQYEISEIVASRIAEILNLANDELKKLSSRKSDSIIITGGITNMINIHQICREKLGNCVIIGNVNLIGLRNNKYSSVFGNIISFANKNTDYTMITEEEMQMLSTPKKNTGSVLGKVFDYFFGDD